MILAKRILKERFVIMENSSFVRFFTKIHKLLFASLLFTISLAVFTGVFALIGWLSGFNNVVLWMLALIPAYPFYAGLVLVIRKYAVEKVDCNITEVFLKTLRTDWKKSLLNGIAFYIVLICSIFAVMYYGTMMINNVNYASIFTIYLIFSLALLGAMFYVSVITVTYDLKIRDIYKNSFIMLVAKILRSICALILTAGVSFLFYLFLDFSGGIYSVFTFVITALLYPLVITYIYVSVISKGIQEGLGSFVAEPEKNEVIVSGELEYDESSDYIFVNGKMVRNPNKN